ncbi:glycoside hydrolase family 18 protein [Rhodothermus profundi]|uniref:chitinase n=1 Tax=Rhodothermus profundi TaxID=633813 RepID=A0A1M6SPD3_9BACT|nr:glycoside hydrolase family 18 protein [Rhodothermus profundi]SHK46601.1 chitinase [Rhodothermus profundi]
MRTSWLCLLSFWISWGCALEQAAPGYRVVGYLYGPRMDSLAVLDLSGLTHVNYAFANVRPDGRVVLETAADSVRLRRLTELRGSDGPQILLSIGGWAWSDYFSDAALTPASRRRFAASAGSLLVGFGLDGLDIDWEYPGQPGEGNVYRAADRENFTRLLATVRTLLDSLTQVQGRPYLLTIAAAAGPAYLAHVEIERVYPLVDFINLMTYDFHGSWTDHTGHHANLYPSSLDPEKMSVDGAVRRYLAAGVPGAKLVIGVPFYGRGWQEVRPEHQGRYQPYGMPVEKELSFAVLQRYYVGREGVTRYWDAEAQAPYLWHPEQRIFISYEDEQSLEAKIAYVRMQQLGGIMFWEYSGDWEGRLRCVVASINPLLQCDEEK